MGEIYAIVSAMFFASANVTITKGAPPGVQDNGAFLSILITVAISCAGMILFGLMRGFPPIDLTGLLWFVLSGVLTIFIGRVFLYASIQRLGAMRATSVKRLTPLFSVVLGVLILSEPVGVGMIVGMALIVASFALLLKETPRAKRMDDTSRAPSCRAMPRLLDYVYGPVSALAYATGYLARKAGMDHIADPNLGTLVGALSGMVAFLAAACVIDDYRRAVGQAFRRWRPWLVAAGTLSSLGQILYFAALNYTTISRVALISTSEVFFTIMLSVWVFRTREKLSAEVLVAATLGVCGAAAVAWI